MNANRAALWCRHARLLQKLNSASITTAEAKGLRLELLEVVRQIREGNKR